MKTKLHLILTGRLCSALVTLFAAVVFVAQAQAASDLPAADIPQSKAAAAIPWSEIGAKAGADYKGDGLAVTPTGDGARLRCVFQRLEGEATSEGLWLVSTATNAPNDRFRVVAAGVGRVPNVAQPSRLRVNGASSPCTGPGDETSPKLAGEDACATSQIRLSRTGMVEVADKVVRFVRPGLTEEYSVSMDGVRQDFVVMERPALDSRLSTLNPPAGALRVELAVSGAKVERTAYGAQLVLEASGRKIAYSRLRVTDATGKELSARMEVDAIPSGLLAVVVEDAEAVYPVRIDPTFSDANWISMGGVPGVDGNVSAAVVDGSGNLYIGGHFRVVADIIANYIAKWNGSSWSALGSGMNFTVSALAVSGSDLYAGGRFTTAGGSAANSIAKWNGSSWSALGSGMNFDVSALAVSGSDLYAGGNFTTAGGSAANRIAKWNGSSWSALGSGMNFTVSALAVSGSDLYAGGWFTTAGGSAANRIAKWNGSSWSALGSGMNFTVSALAVSGSDLYAGGWFTTAGGSAADRIAKWNGSSWSALGSGMNNDVQALAVSGGDLYAGGDFTTAGGSAANYIAKWNGSSWSALGSGMDQYGYVFALAVSGGDLYAGGYFTTAGESAGNGIARWSGSSWSEIGSGMNSVNFIVSALAVSGSDLYVGGAFTTAGGTAANRIAKWDGSSWSALGSGMIGFVNALAVSGSDLYAGGQFMKAGGNDANFIAKWNGSSWSALGSGMNNPVLALAVSGNDLYAGGWFTTAGGSAANYIAKWNGSSWSALGSGMIGFVNALAVSGSDLYAGGDFMTAGGNDANFIAKWNGSSWSALGSGMNNPVLALAVSGNDLYAGGWFTTAGESAANRIAKWNGSSWSALGSGMNNPVWALAVSGSDLYAGGYFTTAGGKVSAYAARADLLTKCIVSNNNDDGPGSLRAAVNDANLAGGLITFAPNVTGTITLTSGRLVVVQGMSIVGPGADVLTVSGNGASEVFAVTNGTSSISGLTLANGTGGIFMHNATLSVSNCVISGHLLFGQNRGGAGIYNGVNGTLILNNSTICTNTVQDFTIVRGGGILNATASSILRMTNCTVSWNGVNSSLSTRGGGIYSAGTLAVMSCTVSRNNTSSGDPGGGIGLGGGTCVIGNSIVADNASPEEGDANGTFNSTGYNLIGVATLSSGWTASDLTGTDVAPLNPLLGTLQHNGGPSPTHALLAGSPALDQGKSFGLLADQRGAERPSDNPLIANASGGDGSDIGAFEQSAISPNAINIWTSPLSGKWEASASWSPQARPAADQTVFLTNAGTKTVTLDATTSGSFPASMTVSNLTVGAPAGSSNTLSLSGAGVPLRVRGNLSLLDGAVVRAVDSVLEVNNGVTPGAGDDGRRAQLDGVAVFNNSTFNASNAFATLIGESHAGSLQVSNGTFKAHGFAVGRGYTGEAEFINSTSRLGYYLSLAGSGGVTGRMVIAGGEFTATNAFFGPEQTTVFIADRGVGDFTASNATVQLGNTVVGNIRGSRGSVTLSGSTVSLGRTFVGGDAEPNGPPTARGAITINGGQVSLPELHLGYQSTGTVTLLGGSLTCPVVTVGEQPGSHGTLTLTSGTMLVASNLTVGDSATSAAGVVTVWDGGALYVTNATRTAVLVVRSGTFTLNPGGTLVVDRIVMTNSSGRFIYNGGTLMQKVAPTLTADLDADGDGLPNGWELSFDLNPFSTAGNDGANGDPDGDGQSNLAEYLSGTEPGYAASVFRITAFALEGANARVTWTTAPGRAYVVQRAPFSPGLFRTNFQPVSPLILWTGAAEGVTNYLVPGGATGPSSAYRVEAIPPP